MLHRIFYIGYYDDEIIQRFRSSSFNSVAATVKMNYVLSCLKDFSEQVTLIALATNRKTGFSPLRFWRRDDGVDCYLVPSVTLRVFGKNIVRGNLTNFFLERLLSRLIRPSDVIIVYHSLSFKSLFEKLKRKLGFRYILQVEEIYCLSTTDFHRRARLKSEKKQIREADGYIFVNDLLSHRYGNGKPSAVSYGTCRLNVMPQWNTEEEIIRIVYTGSISENRDISALLDAIPILPDVYTLNILGAGNDKAIAELKEHIKRVNQLCGNQRVFFDGTRRDAEYSAYLSAFQIGISLMTKGDAFEENAFPSKIMTYLCHGLLVVSSRSRCVEKSKVQDMVTYCDDTAASIANAILNIDIAKRINIPDRLKQLNQAFHDELHYVLQD